MASMPEPDPDALEDRLYTKAEVLAEVLKHTGIVNHAWATAPKAAGPSLPAPRHGLTLLQGGAR